MKILLVFPQADRQTGIHIKDALINLGCDIYVVDPKISPDDMLPAAQMYQPDILFASRTPELRHDMSKIKDVSPNTITMCWNVDVRDSVTEFGPELMELFSKVDIMYTIGVDNTHEYQKLHPKTIAKHLQQGCDPTVHNKFHITPEDRAKYTCDVLAAGSWFDIPENQDRIAVVKAMRDADINVKIFGDREYLRNEEHSKACQCAKICLGMSRWPGVGQSMSVRDYKIMAAGGFLMTNHVKDIDKWFEVDKMCVTYNSPGQAAIKAKYYLFKEEERNIIAEYGYDVVHEKHTYENRMETVLEDYQKFRKGELCLEHTTTQ